MSKYDKLWEYVEEQEGDELVLTFDEIGAIAGVVCALAFSALFPRKKGAPRFAPTEGGAQAGATPVGGDLGRPSTSEDSSPDEGGERR